MTSRYLSLLLLPVCASAQEALRTSLASERIAEQRRREFENQPFNLRWGELKVGLSASASLAYNDNIRLSEAYKESDGIFSPQLNVNSIYPIGEANSLKFNTSVGYSAYFAHSEYNRLSISPGSELEFDVFARDFRINFHDRFSYSMDTGGIGAVSGVARYGGYNNSAGISVSRDFRDFNTQFGYDYATFFSSEKYNSYLDRDTHNIMVRAGMAVHPTATMGLEGGFSPTLYHQPLLNNSTSLSGGVYGDWRLTEHIRFQPRVGLSYYTFDSSPVFGSQPANTAYYFGVRWEHSVSQLVSYSLDAGRDLQPGIWGSLSDRLHAGLNLSWRGIRNITLTGGPLYEDGSEKYGYRDDQYTRIGFNVGASYQILEKLTASLGYRFAIKDSSTVVWNYTQNVVTATITYRF